MTQGSGKIVVAVEDMFFAAKIKGAADAASSQIQRAKSYKQVEEVINSRMPSLLILDLNSDPINPLKVIEFLKSRHDLSAIPIVGFVSHVQVNLIRKAWMAGCDYVIPRSLFTQVLPEIVSGNLASLQTKQTDK